MTPEQEIVAQQNIISAYKRMIGQLIDTNAALMAAGEKMEAALNQCNVRPQVLREWQAVTHQIKRT